MDSDSRCHEIISCLSYSDKVSLSPGLLASISSTSKYLSHMISNEPSESWRRMCIKHFGSTSVKDQPLCSGKFKALYKSLLESRVSFLAFKSSATSYFSSANLTRIVDESSPHQAVATASDVFISKLSHTFCGVKPGRYVLMARLSLDSMCCGMSTTFEIKVRDHLGRQLEGCPPLIKACTTSMWKEYEKQQGTRAWFDAEIIAFEAFRSADGTLDPCFVDFLLRNLDLCPHSMIKMDSAWLLKS